MTKQSYSAPPPPTSSPSTASQSQPTTAGRSDWKDIPADPGRDNWEWEIDEVARQTGIGLTDETWGDDWQQEVDAE